MRALLLVPIASVSVTRRTRWITEMMARTRLATLSSTPPIYSCRISASWDCRKFSIHSVGRRSAEPILPLEEFDRWLGEFIEKVLPRDLVVITADHGNDPTHRGTDHTREQVPLFVLHERETRHLGTRETFADVAATLSEFFELPQRWPVGESFLQQDVAQVSNLRSL